MPSGDFYDVPNPLPPGAPGTIIHAEPLAKPPSGTRGFRVLYHSRSISGTDIAVSGLLFAPSGGPGSNRPIITYAHGTTGLGDQCAPSKSGGAHEVALIASFAAGLGDVLVATDYEGLGTPGVHPYLVGLSEGRGVLDAARAAIAQGYGVSATSPVIILGHSQGGGAALFAAELAPTYAPELEVKGAIAGAPATELATLAGHLTGGPLFGFSIMATAGFEAAYPDLKPPLTAVGEAAVAKAATTCEEPLAEYASTPVSDIFTTDPAASAAFEVRLTENTPGSHATPVPIFIYHGDADTTVPVAASLRYFERACRTGGYTIERKTYPGANHISVILAALGDIESFMSDRIAGKPVPTTPCPLLPS